MTDHTVLDPMAAAMNPQVQSNTFAKTYFGKVNISASFVTLVKGMGRQPWEPNQLTPDGKPTQKLTGIDIHLVCKSKEGEEYAVDRNYIAEFGDGDWVNITLPSLKDIGVTGLVDLNGKFVEAEMVETGKTYTNRSGETKNLTTFKFVRLFGSEAEMEAARAARFAGDTQAVAAPANSPAAAPVYPPGYNTAPAPAAVADPEKAVAMKFLPAYVKSAYSQANGDLMRAQQLLAPMLAAQPILAKYFTVNSPEVSDMLANQIPF